MVGLRNCHTWEIPSQINPEHYFDYAWSESLFEAFGIWAAGYRRLITQLFGDLFLPTFDVVSFILNNYYKGKINTCTIQDFDF